MPYLNIMLLTKRIYYSTQKKISTKSNNLNKLETVIMQFQKLLLFQLLKDLSQQSEDSEIQLQSLREIDVLAE